MTLRESVAAFIEVGDDRRFAGIARPIVVMWRARTDGAQTLRDHAVGHRHQDLLDARRKESSIRQSKSTRQGS